MIIHVIVDSMSIHIIHHREESFRCNVMEKVIYYITLLVFISVWYSNFVPHRFLKWKLFLFRHSNPSISSALRALASLRQNSLPTVVRIFCYSYIVIYMFSCQIPRHISCPSCLSFERLFGCTAMT